MKKLFVLALVLGLLLAVVTPVAARGGRTTAQLNGAITAIDNDAWTIDVLVETPLRYAGDTITVQVNSATKVKLCVDGTAYRISFDDLEEGWYVLATVTFGEDVIATKIIAYP